MANNDSTKRVPLELLCMLILKEGDRYGYEMVQEIESRSGGLLSFNLASVYVALRRLEERGCVSSRTEMTDAARAPHARLLSFGACGGSVSHGAERGIPPHGRRCAERAEKLRGAT